ncbi:carbohydrate ABC transporter substrate-binding protein (CUT1 family) [Melghirimyces profundicolus]|uniref:Carbohydrate ABC transporter substrate-binding protein (CUT1 family) n=1 Tax=Melghirimyces profundicolus TaxID=1242148 RepID=A0A2T6C9F9_9BACL|nr:ABC transporter substrate-binding protein [Melghirimyces profundicolus]PTX64958.1 carbohydrate ABC transporter substrate-binding protein (CUT1 family) [Melghirimyces profundicolus]
MKKTKILVKLPVLCLFVVTALAGCAEPNQAEGKKTVKFWYTWQGPETKEMEKLIDEFNASQDKIKVEGLSQGDVQKQLTAIVGGNPPDLAVHPDENRLASWAHKGAMQPLDPYIKKSGYDLNDFVPGAREAVQYKGKTYGIPMGMNTWMLYYNKDLLKEAGFDGPPETIQELKKYAKKLDRTKENGRLERLGLNPGANFQYIWMYSFGGKMWDPESQEVTPTDPGFRSAVELIGENWKRHGAKNMDRFQSGLGKYNSAQNPFLAGKHAMSIDGIWLASFIDKYASDMNYGIAPIPYDENHPEAKKTGYMNVNLLYIPKGAENPDAAWEFLKWVTAKEQMVKFDSGIGNLPPRKSAIGDPAFDKVPGIDAYTKYVKERDLQPLPSLPFMTEYLAEIQKQTDAIYRKKTSLDDGLKEIEKNVQPKADKILKK